jgi:hypothetical protein
MSSSMEWKSKRNNTEEDFHFIKENVDELVLGVMQFIE